MNEFEYAISGLLCEGEALVVDEIGLKDNRVFDLLKKRAAAISVSGIVPTDEMRSTKSSAAVTNVVKEASPGKGRAARSPMRETVRVSPRRVRSLCRI